MKRYAFLLALTGLSMTADTPKTYTGVVHDGAPVDSHPATQCVVIKGPRYTLQTADGAYILTDEKTAAEYAGKKVEVRGTVTDGNKLHTIEIKPAQ
jgi:hypothetical protein